MQMTLRRKSTAYQWLLLANESVFRYRHRSIFSTEATTSNSRLSLSTCVAWAMRRRSDYLTSHLSTLRCNSSSLISCQQTAAGWEWKPYLTYLLPPSTSRLPHTLECLLYAYEMCEGGVEGRVCQIVLGMPRLVDSSNGHFEKYEGETPDMKSEMHVQIWALRSCCLCDLSHTEMTTGPWQ